MRKVISCLLLFILALPLVSASYSSRYFSVKDTTEPYPVLPGDTLVVGFTISNRDLFCPFNVTAYIDPCPVGWECEETNFCYSADGNYAENLTVEIPDTASPKKYTAYILLKGDYRIRRGDDNIVISVLTKEQADTIDYTKQRSVPVDVVAEEQPDKTDAEKATEDLGSVAEEETQESAEVGEQPASSEVTLGVNTSQIASDVARLESNRSFVEYLSVVLVVLLAFVAAGAYMTFRKEK